MRLCLNASKSKAEDKCKEQYEFLHVVEFLIIDSSKFTY
jgi:hypothetical protein